MEPNIATLRNQRVQLQSLLTNATAEIGRLLVKQESFAKQIRDIDKKLSNVKDIPLRVTDHALLRYIERVLGLNLEELRNQICTKDITEYANTHTVGKYPIENCLAVIEDKVIITIIPKN